MSATNEKPVGVGRHFRQTMRSVIYISTILVATLLFGFRLFTNSVYITGHLKRNPKDTSALVGTIAVFVKGDNKILAQSVTNDKGDFELSFTPNQQKSFDFFCYGLGMDTTLIASYKSFESDTPDMIFYIPGLRKRNALGMTVCPKCNKADKIYEIVYSDGVPDHFDDDTTIHKQNPNPKIIDGAYYEGCIVDVAKYYCDRDNIKF